MNRYLRYCWPIIMLLATALAPSLSITIALMLGALLSLALVTPKTLEPLLTNPRRRLLVTTLIGELIIFIATLFGLDITTARNYALLLLVAASPLGLEITVALLRHAKHGRNSETNKTAVSYAAEDSYALTIVIALSFAGTIALGIPPALSVLQLLLISCVARPLLSGKALQLTPHASARRWRIFFSSLTVYGSFIFFYIRHYIEPAHADVINPATLQATTLAMAVFIACQSAMVGFNPKAPKIVAYRIIAVTAIVIVASYLPWLQSMLLTNGLAAADWAWIIIAGLYYAALCILQAYFSTHNRQTVLALHREINQL